MNSEGDRGGWCEHGQSTGGNAVLVLASPEIEGKELRPTAPNDFVDG